MATTKLTGAPVRADHDRPTTPSSCSVVTPRGTRTPSGAPIACAGGHAAGDPHGGPFGKAGWHTWTDGSTTAPLPALAAEALSRLERAFLPAEIVAAVTRYETAAARYDELYFLPAAEREAGDAEQIFAAQDVMSSALDVLYRAGHADLLNPLWTADRYRSASAYCRELALAGDYAACLPVQDEMAMCLCQLKTAGRLDLVGVTQ